ncbi:hypothetical protein Droror1_Dr00010783 [Drosera rotundifolia]
MRVKPRGNWKLSKKLLGGLPHHHALLSTPLLVFSISISFFIAGFFASSLFSQDRRVMVRSGSRSRLLKSMYAESGVGRGGGGGVLVAGESGDDFVTTIPFQILSWKPRAVYFPKFASPEQCQAVIDVAKSYVKPSTLALREGESEESTKGVRTSSGTFITASEDNTGVLDFVEEKIARATMIPRVYGEAFNILRYEIGEKYNSHYDVFNPAEYGPQTSQRVASFLLYLSEVEEGGETMFPFEDDKLDASYDFTQCIGLKVKPKQGDGLLFYSLFVNGTIDPTSLHGSCPVIKGGKWVATKWIRDHEQYD